MTSRYLLVPALATVLFTQSDLRADDWPQWRGPHRDGISQETGLLKEWPKAGPKQLWQVKGLGGGYSAPAIAGGAVYLLANEGLDNEYLKSLSADAGGELWKARLGKVGNPNQKPSYPGARSAPTVDGEFVYTLSSDGDLVCVEAKSGKIKWQHNVRSDFGGEPGIWAYSESPLVDGDAVVCTPGGATATMLALNKHNGEVIWKSAIGGEQAAYASIITTEVAGKKQYVQFLQKGVVGVDTKTGHLLWRYDRPAQGSPANIPTPVADGRYVYAASGRGGGGLVKLTADDGKIEAEPVYFESKVPTAIGGSVKIGDYLYGTSSSLLCLEFLTGKVQWEDRSIGAAALCYANGHLYLHGENGEVALVEATADGYHEKGRFTPADIPAGRNGKAWAYPAIADGRLYIHDSGSVWCYDIKAQ